MAKLADARDLKSRVSKETYRFNSDPGHHLISNNEQVYTTLLILAEGLGMVSFSESCPFRSQRICHGSLATWHTCVVVTGYVFDLAEWSHEGVALLCRLGHIAPGIYVNSISLMEPGFAAFLEGN